MKKQLTTLTLNWRVKESTRKDFPRRKNKRACDKNCLWLESEYGGKLALRWGCKGQVKGLEQPRGGVGVWLGHWTVAPSTITVILETQHHVEGSILVVQSKARSARQQGGRQGESCPTLSLHTRTARARKFPNLIPPQRFASGTTPTTEATTETVKVAKKSHIVRNITTVTLLAATVYSGAIYYSLKNEAFRDSFTTYVWGAEDVLDRIEELAKRDDVKQYRDQIVTIGQTTSQYASKAKEYSIKAKDATTSAYEKITGSASSDQAGEANKQSSVPTIKSTSVETTIVKKPSDSASKPVSVEKTTVVVPIPVNSSSELALSELSRTINELVSILNDAGLGGKAKSFVETAKIDLAQLSERFNVLRDGENAIVDAFTQLQTKTDKLQAAFDNYHNDFANRLSVTEKTAAEELARQSEQLQKSFDAALISELSQERVRHATELADALVAQAVEMQRDWIREVRYRVEHERAGRLAKLDDILIRLKALERISLNNAEHLDHSSRAHQLWTAVRALTHAVHEPRAFANELEVLRDIASGSRDHAELVGTIVASIDRVSERGVHSVSDLAARWRVVREEVRRASLVPEDGGFMSHALSVLLSRVMFRKHGLVPGNDVEAICARVEWYLHENDLDSAARELNQLTGWPKKLVKDWIELARRHLEVKQALEVRYFGVVVTVCLGKKRIFVLISDKPSVHLPGCGNTSQSREPAAGLKAWIAVDLDGRDG
ncbi:mitochondrial inner membrane protein-domain-containing protein [Endogone sp. FLAS-F59071]|nr:mitochondrial inner membrane protein-domain-containing protein [Endogone sp. FLAS-F59071]|eukprot:RUS22781.1 mitochondrial inner membrane protein-domain-containing protein [Endogone sp. FLAS-F59071]